MDSNMQTEITKGLKIALTSGAVSLALTTNAHAADCKATIVGILDLNSTQNKMRAYQETALNGKVVLKYNIWIESYSRRMTETIGRGIWSLLYDKYHYDGTDGKNWTRSTWSDPNWKATADKAQAALRAGMTETQCGLTGKVDGKTYQVFKYRFKIEKPYKSDTKTTLFFDPKAKRIVRRVDDTDSSGTPATITTTYTPDATVVISKPD